MGSRSMYQNIQILVLKQKTWGEISVQGRKYKNNIKKK